MLIREGAQAVEERVFSVEGHQRNKQLHHLSLNTVPCCQCRQCLYVCVSVCYVCLKCICRAGEEKLSKVRFYNDEKTRTHCANGT